MRKSTFCATLILGLCCLAASTSNAQQTYIYSQIAYNDSTNTVYGYSATEIDYSCSYDYHAYVDAFLYDQSNHLLDAGQDEEPQLAEVLTSASGNAGAGYRVEGYHDMIALYYHEVIDKAPDGCWPCDGCYTDCYYFYDNWFWYDSFGFSSTSPGYYGPWHYLFGNGPPVEVENDEYIPLGSTSESLQTPPTVDRIQYQSGSSYVDISGTLYVLKDTSVTFKALPNPSNVSFPNGKPTWSGSSGASGTGATKSVTFSTISSSTTDYKTVIATAGTSSVTVNVVVYSLTGVLTPQDNFTGRSNTSFGVAEVIVLSFTASPSVTATQAGGLLWKQTTGNGTLTAASSDGTGSYTAASSPESVTLKLEVQAGPSKTLGPSPAISVIAPSGAYQVQNPGTGVKHIVNTCSAGFQAITYLLPTNVSFINVQAREGTTTASATGWLAPANGNTHNTGSWQSVANCNTSTGCQIQAIDTIYSEFSQNFGGTTWGVGDFQWNIPREWRVGTGSGTQYTSLLHHFVSDAAGKATISKGGAGPFSKNASDATSNY